MTVRQEPLVSKPAAKESIHESRKASAVVSRATLKQQRGTVERYAAWVVLIIGGLGSVIAFHGGPTVFASFQWTVTGWVLGIGAQALLTFLEYWYYDRWYVSWPARCVDATLTALGYGPLLAPALAAYLETRGVPAAAYGLPTLLGATWSILGGIGLLAAWWPESRLVD